MKGMGMGMGMGSRLRCGLSQLGSPLIVRSPFLHTRWISEKRVDLDGGDSSKPKSVQVSMALHLLSAGYTILDVRSSEEFKTGHPAGAFNIPYMFQTKTQGMLKNPHFADQVLSSFKKDDQIIIGCRSGKRSLIAATDLVSLGFTSIVDLAGGYLAWIQNGLPVNKAEE